MATVTISADYDGDVTNDGSTVTDTDDQIRVNAQSSSTARRRGYARFSLTNLPAHAIVSQVDILLQVEDASDASSDLDIYAYKSDGRDDPEDDNGSATTMWTNCASGTQYVNGDTEWESTGIKTITLSAQANTDIMVARAAATPIFALALKHDNETATNLVIFEAEDEGATTDGPKLTITYSYTADVRQVHFIPYRPAPDPEVNPELALSLAGALPKILVGSWRGEDIVWHDVWTLDSARIEKLVLGRTTAANSPGPRTLYPITADGIYYMATGAEAHPAVAPWPLTHGTPHAQQASGNDFGEPGHVKSVELMTIFGEHLMGSEGDELTILTHWDGADRWDKLGPYFAFPATVGPVSGRGNVLYVLYQIKDNARSALAPYVSNIKIAIGDWTDLGPIERIQAETDSPQSM